MAELTHFLLGLVCPLHHSRNLMKMLQTQTVEADSISSSNRATVESVACKPLPSVVYRRVVAQHPLQVLG